MQVVLLLLLGRRRQRQGAGKRCHGNGSAFSLSLLSSSTPCDAACAHSPPPLIPGRPALLLDLGLLADVIKPLDLLPLEPRASFTSRFPNRWLAGPLAALNHNNLFW